MADSTLRVGRDDWIAVLEHLNTHDFRTLAARNDARVSKITYGPIAQRVDVQVCVTREGNPL